MKRAAFVLDNHSSFTYVEDDIGMIGVAGVMSMTDPSLLQTSTSPQRDLVSVAMNAFGAYLNTLIGLWTSQPTVVSNNVAILNEMSNLLKVAAGVSENTQKRGEKTFDQIQLTLLNVKRNNAAMDEEIDVLTREEKSKRMYYIISVAMIFVGILLSIVVFAYPPNNNTISTVIGTVLILAGIMVIILKATGKLIL
jgi:hypothetical protein